jgi:hypothetical protein
MTRCVAFLKEKEEETRCNALLNNLDDPNGVGTTGVS